MKFKGVVKLRKVTPQGMEYRAEVGGLPFPLNITIPAAKGLQAEGTVVIEIPEVEEPKAKKGKQ
jgi:hypothetical protein